MSSPNKLLKVQLVTCEVMWCCVVIASRLFVKFPLVVYEDPVSAMPVLGTLAEVGTIGGEEPLLTWFSCC